MLYSSRVKFLSSIDKQGTVFEPKDPKNLNYLGLLWTVSYFSGTQDNSPRIVCKALTTSVPPVKTIYKFRLFSFNFLLIFFCSLVKYYTQT